MTRQSVIDDRRLVRLEREYRADGYAVVSSPFDPAEVGAWQLECARLAGLLDEADPSDPRIQSRGHQARGVVRDRYDPVTDFSPLFRDLAGDSRLLSIAACILDAVPILLKDRLILKSAGTLGYGLHMDWPYWEWLGIPPDEIVTLMLSVDATDATNGAIEVFAGLQRTPLPAAADDPRDLDPKAVEGLQPRLATTRAGDILLLHPTAPHRSGPNLSGGSRRIVTFIYTVDRHAGARERYYSSLSR